MKAEQLKLKKRSLECSIDDDPRPLKYRALPGYNDHVRNLVINFSCHSNENIAMRFNFQRANLKEATLDHQYTEKMFTEYWIDSSLKVIIILCEQMCLFGALCCSVTF